MGQHLGNIGPLLAMKEKCLPHYLKHLSSIGPIGFPTFISMQSTTFAFSSCIDDYVHFTLLSMVSKTQSVHNTWHMLHLTGFPKTIVSTTWIFVRWPQMYMHPRLFDIICRTRLISLTVLITFWGMMTDLVRLITLWWQQICQVVLTCMIYLWPSHKYLAWLALGL